MVTVWFILIDCCITNCKLWNSMECCIKGNIMQEVDEGGREFRFSPDNSFSNNDEELETPDDRRVLMFMAGFVLRLAIVA